MVFRSYENLKVIRQSVFKLSRLQAMVTWKDWKSAMAAILFFPECPKSIASEVLMTLTPYPNFKMIGWSVQKLSRLQAIVDGRTDGPTHESYIVGKILYGVFYQANLTLWVPPWDTHKISTLWVNMFLYIPRFYVQNILGLSFIK